MRGEPLKHPRKVGEHVSRAIDLLAENGATKIRVFKTKHIIITFCLGKHEIEVRTVCTPRSVDAAFVYFKTDLRHEIERRSGLR